MAGNTDPLGALQRELESLRKEVASLRPSGVFLPATTIPSRPWRGSDYEAWALLGVPEEDRGTSLHNSELLLVTQVHLSHCLDEAYAAGQWSSFPGPLPIEDKPLCPKCLGVGWVDTSDHMRNKRCSCNP